MKALVWSCLVVGVFLCTAAATRTQTPVGALAVDERQGDRYGWAADYETLAAARAAALGECGPGCSVVLTFNRCGAYAADQDAGSTAVGWAQSYDSADGARQAALAECRSRGGSGCIVRAWGCNGPVVEEGLNLDRSARREIQQGLQAGGFDPGGADGLFGPRTRAAIRNWQSARGGRTTGYLDAAQVEALRGAARVRPVAAASQPPPATAEQETVFWQSIANSTDPADFEAYLRRFPNGVFSDLAQNRLAAMRGPAGSPSPDAGSSAGGTGTPTSGPRISGSAARASGSAAGGDARPRAGTVSRPVQTCAGQPAGAACWMEISQRPGCHVWNPGLAPGATVTWTGGCGGGFAQGMGTLTWLWDGNRQTATGRLEDGRRNGHWLFRFPNGDVQEGPMADDTRNGHWVLRYADGNVWEGSNVNGARNGRWVIRYADGAVGEGLFVDDEPDGTWVIRAADGTVEERVFRDGERVR